MAIQSTGDLDTSWSEYLVLFNRHVCGFQYVPIGQGGEKLVLLLGSDTTSAVIIAVLSDK